VIASNIVGLLARQLIFPISLSLLAKISKQFSFFDLEN